MKPKYETTGRSLGSPSAAFAASWSPGRKRSRSTEFGTTVESTPKTPATSWLIAIEVVAKRRIAVRTKSERRSRPPSGSAERRCQTTGSDSRRASQAAGISGESLKWTSSKRCRRSVRRKRRPIVWLLQDQWAYTGHVAYSLDCERWRHGCGSCPYLDEYPRLRRDTTASLWRLKRAVYRRSRLTIIVPSRWMLELARSSPLLARFPMHRIPHGVDTEVFRPLPKDEARRRLGLPEDRPLVLFSASDLNEPRKGLHLLEEALVRMDDPPLLALAGAGEIPRRVETAWLGSIGDDEVLAQAYSAADVLAVPTVADALTQTAIESIACGTPCVAFDRGGVTDVVAHLDTGYQARFGDVDDLARGLATVLEDAERFAPRCREVAEREFSVDVQVRRYVALYEEVLAA